MILYNRKYNTVVEVVPLEVRENGYVCRLVKFTHNDIVVYSWFYCVTMNLKN